MIRAIDSRFSAVCVWLWRVIEETKVSMIAKRICPIATVKEQKTACSYDVCDQA